MKIQLGTAFALAVWQATAASLTSSSTTLAHTLAPAAAFSNSSANSSTARPTVNRGSTGAHTHGPIIAASIGLAAAIFLL